MDVKRGTAVLFPHLLLLLVLLNVVACSGSDSSSTPSQHSPNSPNSPSPTVSVVQEAYVKASNAERPISLAPRSRFRQTRLPWAPGTKAVARPASMGIR